MFPKRIRQLSGPIAFGIAWLLTACGGGGGYSSPNAPTYTIGGTISGLGNSLSVTLHDNGGDPLIVSANGAFTFKTALAGGSAYAVTVATPPAGQLCTISSGSGNVGTSNVSSVVISCAFSKVWAWKGGSDISGQSGVYGTLGVAAASNVPGARNWQFSWKDSSGSLWLFGGSGRDSAGNGGDLNDLWRYNPSSGEWTWMNGSKLVSAPGVYGTLGTASASNVPGAREFGVSWTDTSGNLWLFGGLGIDAAATSGYLNDFWKYDVATGLWTWEGGSNSVNTAGVYGTLGIPAVANIPGGRHGNASWTDSSGNVWMFGGQGYDSIGTYGYLNDLWMYNPGTGRWTWEAGAKTANAAGVYGTRGMASITNIPGARGAGQVWTDAAGNLWMFGGYGMDSASAVDYLSDLWKYDPSAGTWTWASGSNLVRAPGVYGTMGMAAANNAPGARGGSVGWSDTSGNLWMLGGFGFDSASGEDDLNDLWQFNLASSSWTWMRGSNLVAASGVYGTLGTPSASTQPGARDSGNVWVGGQGNVWLFGGAGYDSTGIYDSFGMNDLFEYIP